MDLSAVHQRSIAAATVVITLAVGGCGRESSQSNTDYANRLQEMVSTDAVMTHLRSLQDIADVNGGIRSTGTPGYSASVDYVVEALKDRGFDVETPEFELRVFDVDAESLTLNGNVVPARAVEFSGASGPEGVTGPMVVVPSDDSPGCQAADYRGLTARGAVAVVERGDCNLSDKAAVAAGRGALGLIIVNNTDEKAFSGGFLESDVVSIPVVSLSQVDGAALRTQTGTATLVVDARTNQVSAKNVVAQTTTGSRQNVVMVGAHLDSVRQGPGVNDDGSGVAAVLQTALAMGSTPPVRNAVRFALWGGEEEYLVGSDAYVRSLDVEALKDIALYLNFDMVGSPNPGYFTLDGNLSTPPDPESLPDPAFSHPPEGSAPIEQAFAASLSKVGITTQDLLFDGRGDYSAFVRAGIPAGQLFTGAEEIKTPEQAEKWGGQAGQPFDPNYHGPGDTLGNVSRFALDVTLPAIGHVVGLYADDEGAQGIPSRSDRTRQLLRE